ncbi:hypothetical protein GCM10017643_36340 [Ancylobacter dichloromethanicus]|uniref:Uncharacterized protein n=1 Tax=Ancylobacter dichloromethanicus TaxID=518825 RepID=A0A9W6JA57_9HYPH|nr:hypothetical protein GCM10017643_36340 [Ancylobacter dichloromethanicus]
MIESLTMTVTSTVAVIAISIPIGIVGGSPETAGFRARYSIGISVSTRMFRVGCRPGGRATQAAPGDVPFGVVNSATQLA